ncbi:MAG: crossover junction endodeoxyribonuclease RuvC [Pseudomonadota bacterium]
MRVLGIDPGTRFTGFGVVQQDRGRLLHVASGVIRADADLPLEKRLHVIHAALCNELRRHRPDAVAVEGLFSHRNARSALVLGHARGVALLAAAGAGLDVHEYAPARVKKAVGAGGADGKDAVARMVKVLLQLDDTSRRADVTDALAVALCHLNQVSGHAAGVVPLRRGRARAAGLASLADRLQPAVVRKAVAR